MSTTVPVRALPEHPDLDQLRTQARELQRDVRSGIPPALRRAALGHPDPDFPLHAARLLLAREYGFPNWPRLQRQVAAIVARTWDVAEPSADESLADQLLRLACLDYGTDSPVRVRSAGELLGRYPELHETATVAVAAVCGRRELVAQAIRTTAASSLVWPARSPSSPVSSAAVKAINHPTDTRWAWPRCSSRPAPPERRTDALQPAVPHRGRLPRTAARPRPGSRTARPLDAAAAGRIGVADRAGAQSARLGRVARSAGPCCTISRTG